MKLAVFDIDGTLTQTNAVDNDCFVRAFTEVTGIRSINTNWAEYGHTTDSGIALQIFQEQLDRAPSIEELQRIQQRFLEHLQQQFNAAPDRFSLVPGAIALLSPPADWQIAIATGGWRSIAQFKLQATPFLDLPAAFADDDISREGIVKSAIARASQAYDQPQFEKIVCVGDGIWDAMTAAQLQLGFVAVGEADWINCRLIAIPDFEAIETFWPLLDRSQPPDAKRLAAVQQQIFQHKSLPPSYFEALYTHQLDPWGFETSEYEASKYAATLAALPKSNYRSAFEIGGSIGVLTAQLADRAQALLSVDVSEQAQQRAIDRCRHLPHVRFELMNVPQQFSSETFDLILISEVGYYWCWADLKLAQQRILDRLESGGHLLLVHWTEYARDYPLSGDQVHDAFLALPQLRHQFDRREAQYRIDLFERT